MLFLICVIAFLQELELYREYLLNKPALLVVNKMDVEGAWDNFKEIEKSLRNMEGKISRIRLNRYNNSFSSICMEMSFFLATLRTLQIRALIYIAYIQGVSGKCCNNASNMLQKKQKIRTSNIYSK